MRARDCDRAAAFDSSSRHFFEPSTVLGFLGCGFAIVTFRRVRKLHSDSLVRGNPLRFTLASKSLTLRYRASSSSLHSRAPDAHSHSLLALTFGDAIQGYNVRSTLDLLRTCTQPTYGCLDTTKTRRCCMGAYKKCPHF